MVNDVSAEKKDVSPKELGEFLVLLTGDWMQIPDEKILALLNAQEPIQKVINRLDRDFPFVLEQILRFRKKKEEIDKLSTVELQAKYRETNRRRAVFIAADEDDSLDDSCFEAPRIDSEEHIIYEILRERKAL